jgi:hypothetical protein
MNNVNFEIGQNVKVTFGVLDGGRTWEFESKVMDIVDNSRNQGVWVDHPECRGEDMLFVELTNPYVNKVESIEEEVEVKRSTTKETEMKEAHKTLDKAFKWVEEDIKVSVKIYDCFEDNSSWEQFDDQQSYDVEIQWAIGEDSYTDCIVIDSYYSTIEDDEVAKNMAMQRAKSVLRTVKGWYDRHDNITVVDGIEVYHA